jgi:hypothetical protein
VDERPALYARMRPRVYCSLAQGKQGRWRIRGSARLLGLAAVLGKRAERRCVPLGPTAGHARPLGTETRWWEVPMLRSRVTELHYITPVANLGSIATHGVLSHNLAARLPHPSAALERVQDRRTLIRVPRDRPLHDYANLYFDARNAMMYLRKDGVVRLAVVRPHPAVLDLPGSVITDGNAASGNTIFLPSPSGLARLDEERVYAESWDSPDYWIKVERKRARCAELLVPERVEPRFILGCYVDHWNRRPECIAQAPGLVVEVNAYVFFR